MREPVAEIVAVSGGMATVLVEPGVACARCAAGKGCGAGLLAGAPRARRFKTPVPHGLDLAAGDRVTLELAPRNLLRAAVAVYGVPLVAVVGAPALAQVLWGPLSDATLAGLAAVTLIAALVDGRRRLAQSACLAQFVPSIGRRVAAGDDG